MSDGGSEDEPGDRGWMSVEGPDCWFVVSMVGGSNRPKTRRGEGG